MAAIEHAKQCVCSRVKVIEPVHAAVELFERHEVFDTFDGRDLFFCAVHLCNPSQLMRVQPAIVIGIAISFHKLAEIVVGEVGGTDSFAKTNQEPSIKNSGSIDDEIVSKAGTQVTYPKR